MSGFSNPNLTVSTSVISSDSFPFFSSQNGGWRQASLSVIVTFLSTAFSSLTLSNYTKVTPVTVANLPAAATAGSGAKAQVSDAANPIVGIAPTGSGSTACEVTSNGTAWIVTALNALVTMTVADLPAAASGNTGARTVVTDATATTFASTVAGSGANTVPVLSNGTNWIIG